MRDSNKGTTPVASYSVRYIFDFVVHNTASLTAAAAAVKGLTTAMTGAAGAMAIFGRAAMLGGMAAGIGAAAMVSGGIKAAAAFEDKMAEVRKVVPDMTKEMMWDLGDEVLKLSTKSAVAADAVADIFASGARMGIRGKDALSQFAETVVKVAAAWDGVSASQAAEALATISGKFFNSLPPLEAQKRMISVTDAINYLAQNSAGVKNSELLKFYQNAGPQAAQFGLSAEQTAALGAVTMQTGRSGGLISGTQAESTLRRLSLAATGKIKGKGGLTDLGQSFKDLGMTQGQWAQMMKSGPQDALLNLMGRLEGMDNLQQQKILKGLLGDSKAAKPLIAITNQLNEYKRALAQVSDEYAGRFLKDKKFMDWMEKAYPAQAKLLRENQKALHHGSVDQEYKARLETMQKQVERFKNALYELKVEVGKPFLDPLAAGFGWLADKISANKGVMSNLVTGGAIAGIAAFGTAALRVIGYLTGIGGALAVLKRLGMVTLKISVFAIGIAAIMWVYNNWDKLKQLAADPIKFNVIFPEAPDWMKNSIDWFKKQNERYGDQWGGHMFDRFGTSDGMSSAPKRWFEWDQRPVMRADRGFSDEVGAWGRRLSDVPGAVTANVTATFAPATVNVQVNGNVDASGLIRLQGQGQGNLQASQRGTSSPEVGLGRGGATIGNSGVE